MKVFADLQSRGCQDILIAVTDGLKGMREALEALYPATTFQTCLVHLLRHSLDFANWKERKPLAAALRPIYTAASADVAAAALDAFADEPWGRRFPTVVASWRRAWPHVIPFFAVPPAIRRVLYTTHALESVHARLRKILKTRGHFPTDEAATTLIWLALRNITAGWWRAANYWHLAMNQFAILYDDRFTRPLDRRLPARMDAAVAVDAQTAPTASTRSVVNAPHTKIRALPPQVQLVKKRTSVRLRSSVPPMNVIFSVSSVPSVCYRPVTSVRSQSCSTSVP